MRCDDASALDDLDQMRARTDQHGDAARRRHRCGPDQLDHAIRFIALRRRSACTPICGIQRRRCTGNAGRVRNCAGFDIIARRQESLGTSGSPTPQFPARERKFTLSVERLQPDRADAFQARFQETGSRRPAESDRWIASDRQPGTACAHRPAPIRPSVSRSVQIACRRCLEIRPPGYVWMRWPSASARSSGASTWPRAAEARIDSSAKSTRPRSRNTSCNSATASVSTETAASTACHCDSVNSGAGNLRNRARRSIRASSLSRAGCSQRA